jgi:hypothetical protein
MGDFLQFLLINDTQLIIFNKHTIDFYIHKINTKKIISKAFGKITFDQIVLS